MDASNFEVETCNDGGLHPERWRSLPATVQFGTSTFHLFAGTMEVRPATLRLRTSTLHLFAATMEVWTCTFPPQNLNVPPRRWNDGGQTCNFALRNLNAGPLRWNDTVLDLSELESRVTAQFFTATASERHDACNSSSIFAQSASVTPPASAFVSRIVIASARKRPCSIRRSTGIL